MVKKYKENNLLYYGAGILFCTIVSYILTNIYFEDRINDLSRLNFDLSFGSLILLTLFIAPVIEEFIFRSIFLNKRNYKYIFYAGITIYILLTNNYYVLVILGFYFVADYRKIKGTLLFYLNAGIFALIHYQISDFRSFFTIQPMFFQFSLGLILIWVVINWGLMKAILCHFLYNLIIILPVLLIVQFPQKLRSTVENDSVELIWSKTNYFVKTEIQIDKQQTDIKGLSIKDFYGIYGNKANIKVDDSLKFYKFNFKIINKENQKIDSLKVRELLYKARLIEKI